ncbi:septin 7 [Nematocida sp. LUAm3]|nr:septin 7 [Nematocida sp. LUAm3]KAI5175928.1 septin 7 [Nematocida sp. LUAm2]KAI5178690.1 septin 7 [Nematocida sp. LUAm1]
MRILKKGTRLNLLLVGASGVGKSSFIQSVSKKPIESTGDFSTHSTEIEGQSVYFYEARGYGDAINIEDRFYEIKEFICKRFRDHLNEENKIDRDMFTGDRRIHLVIFFVSPSAQGIKEQDLNLLKRLHTLVNCIIVIPKSDYYTDEELSGIKEKINVTMGDNQIDLFEVNEVSSGDLPFSIVCGNKVSNDGVEFGSRVNPFGVISLKDERFSNYSLLLKMFSFARDDLLNTTHLYFYEKYRTEILRSNEEVEK